MTAAGRHVSLPSTFATGDAVQWFRRFEICSKANDWNEATQALKMPTLLEGEALAIWMELEEDDQKDYKRAKEKIIGKMMPMAFTTLDDFHRRQLRPGEPLPLFVHGLKTLLKRAMPDIDAIARSQLVLHQFLVGLPVKVSRQLRASGETNDLDKTIERARLLMAIDDQEQDDATAAAVSAQRDEVEKLKEKIAELTQQVSAVSQVHETKGADAGA